MVLKLQEDHNISIYGIFLFWVSGPKYGNQLQGHPKKVYFQVSFYQSLTGNMAFLKWCH